MEYGEEEWGQISSKLCMVSIALGFIYLCILKYQIALITTKQEEIMATWKLWSMKNIK